MTLFMETTSISAEQTISEIQKILVKHGAKAIQTDYNGGEISALVFILPIGKAEQPFRLPARWEALYEVFISRRKQNRWKQAVQDADRLQAKRVAWRQILRWVEAQLALVETNMVKMEEVFMPYLVMPDGQTLFQMVEQKQFLIEAPKK